MSEDKVRRPEDYTTLAAMLRLETVGRMWAIQPDWLTGLADLHGSSLSAAAFDDIQAATAAGPRTRVDAGGVATVPLKGVLMPRVSLLAMLFGGGSSLIAFQSEFRQAIADPEVSAVVLDVDSPGGLTDMIPEIGSEIADARDKKPIVAVANTLAASAAYWLASQAHQIVVTPSGEVGSIGVYQVHRDMSQAMEMAGVKPTIVSAGKYKVEGNPWEPLTDEAAAATQSDVNDYYAMFTSAVAQGRGDTQENVQNGYGEGRTLLAKRAVRAGLADKVDTLENTVKRLNNARARKAVTDRAADADLGGGQPEPTPVAVAYSSEDRSRLLDTLAGLR